MIHSLSGGVIADNMPLNFAKVAIMGAPYWYVAPFPVEAGDRVLAPFGTEEKLLEATVLKVEVCTPQTAPVPVARVKFLEKRLGNV